MESIDKIIRAAGFSAQRPLSWDDHTWPGKRWWCYHLPRETDGRKARIYLWEGTAIEALKAFGSKGGEEKIATQRTAGMLIEKTASAVARLAIDGWDDGRVLAATVADSVALGPATWPARALYECYGDEPDVAAYCSGMPENMISWAEEDGARAIGGYQDIVAHVGVAYSVKPELMALVGAIIMSCVDYLESCGVRVRLYAASLSTNLGGIKQVHHRRMFHEIMQENRIAEHVRILVKDYEDPLHQGITAFWCGHPAVLRGIVFGLFGGAAELERVLPGVGCETGIIADDPGKWPYGGWEDGVFAIPEGLIPPKHHGAYVLVSLLEAMAVIAKWCGRDAAASWVRQVGDAIASILARDRGYSVYQLVSAVDEGVYADGQIAFTGVTSFPGIREWHGCSGDTISVGSLKDVVELATHQSRYLPADPWADEKKPEAQGGEV